MFCETFCKISKISPKVAVFSRSSGRHNTDRCAYYLTVHSTIRVAFAILGNHVSMCLLVSSAVLWQCLAESCKLSLQANIRFSLVQINLVKHRARLDSEQHRIDCNAIHQLFCRRAEK